VEELRAQFPVLDRVAYLNAGTNGPVPRAALDAAGASLREQLEQGRSSKPWFEHQVERIGSLRERVAALFGATAADVAVTGSTTDGVNAVLHAVEIRPGDEILTSDEEHPGVLGPLASARDTRGARVRVVPFEELPDEVGADTRFVVCSHVSWATGRVMDTEPLAASGAIVVLDGAQGLGAVPLDMAALGCDFYAASGQKWLCGPNGIGYLYVRGELAGSLLSPWPGYANLADSTRALDLDLHPDARRLSVGFPLAHHVDWALAALDVLGRPGLAQVQARAADLADGLAGRLGSRVKPRGRSTLVTWEVEDPEAEVARLAAAGFAIRELPGTGTVRASVGAWSSEPALERLAELTCR
jgi:selenocysteine lyase/cysteine desulfurase